MDILRRTFDGTLAQDLAFGPEFGNFFDFSLTFESTILTIAPVAVWLAIFPFHIWHYKRRPVVATAGLHFWVLTIVAVTHACMEIAKAAVWGIAPNGAEATFAASSALSALAAVALVAMTISEYRHSLNSSSLNSGMLTILCFVDIIKSRSFFMRDGLATVGALSAATAALKAVLVILQEVPKPRIAELADKGSSAEASSGVWNQALCFWVNKILLHGARRALTMKDLEYLGPDFASARLDAECRSIWKTEDKSSKWALAKTTGKSLRWLILASILSRMVSSCCEWAMIFSIRVTVASLGQPVPDWTPKALIIGNIAAYALKITVLSMHTFFINKTCSLARGLLTTQIIRKNFTLKKTIAKESKAITLMSTDVEQICDLLLVFPQFFVAIPELGFGLYFMYTLIEAAFVLPLVTAIGGCCIAILMNSPMMNAQRYWNESIQDRVAKMSTILLQIKGIKMIGLETTISKFMQNIRINETKRSLRMRWLRVFAQANGGVQLTITPVIGIIGGLYWTVWRNGVDAASLFTYLSLLSMCIDPLNVIILDLPGLGGALANFTRIQEFLLEEEQRDPRQVRINIDQEESLSDKPQTEADSSGSDPEKSPLLESTTQIAFRNVSIPSLATENSSNVLNSMNLTFQTSSLNIVIGPVGSGKSVLLATIIGETSPSEGSIYITTNNMAFCHQVAWIPSSTIRQAIIGENDFDAEWYQTVVKACALDYDIAKITDQAMTGNDSGGLLSGGQKQRVALARAVYSKAPILVLDDILSALDQRTARAVFTRLFAPDGLLKQQRRTVILATHSVEWLDEADQVVSVQSSGDVLTYESKEDIAVAKAEVMAAQGEHQSVDAEEEDITMKLEDDTAAKEDEISGMLTSDGKLYRLLFGAVPVWLLLALLANIIATPIAESTPQLIARIWLSINPMANYFVFIMLAIALIYPFMNGFLIWLWSIVTIPKIANNLHELFLSSVMAATLPFLTKSQSGALLNRFSQDMTLFSYKMPHSVFGFAMYLGYAVVQGVYLVAGSAYTAITIPFLVLAVYILQKFYLLTSKQMRILDLEAKTPLFSKITEVALGVDHIRAYGWQEQTMTRMYHALDQSQKSFYYMYTVQRWLLVAISLISLVVTVIMLAVALFVTNSSSQAGLGLSMMSVINFQNALNKTLIQWTALETSLGAVARLKNFLRDTPVEKDDEHATEQPPSWPSKGEIEFKNVSAAYNPDPDARLVITDLSVKLEAGKSTAIVGRTGSGKSSVVLTLLNFLHHTGSVTIDGVDISQVPLAQLRHVITTIPQDHVDIPGSVRDNVLPLEIMDEQGVRNEGDAELTEVLQTVGLWEYVSSHGGLDEPIDKMELSAGQRQLLSMARAMLHHRKTGSKIVIMDEATSNMDYQTDTKIHDIMETAFAGSTRLVVTHRNTVLSHCHALIKMEDGRMISSETNSIAGSEKEEKQE